MKRIVLLAVLVLGFVTGHAAAQEVTYNFDRDTDFSKFISYKWVDIKSVQQVDFLTSQQIAHVIDDELAKKGLFKTDSDYADLYIGFQTALSRQTLWMPYQNGWGYGAGWGGGLAAMAEASIHAGQLDLDVYAAAEKKLVWRGAVSNAFNLSLTLDRSETKIQESVKKLLKNYPSKGSPSADRQRARAERNTEQRRNGSAAHCFLCRIAPSALFRLRASKNR